MPSIHKISYLAEKAGVLLKFPKIRDKGQTSFDSTIF